MRLNALSEQFEKRLFYWILFLLFVLFVILNLLSEGSYGGGDDIVHYRFAHFAFKYPELFLDHWAKPLFTLLASPFAQLGYWGIKVFNVLTGTATAYFLYKITLLLKIRRGWVLPVFLFFIPVYSTMLLSGMTEILFSFVLILAIYFAFKENYIWSAIVISFLPLARTEGIVIWPVFALVFLWKREWKSLPFMITGSLIYSIIGGFYFNDFLWLINRMPYSNTLDVYGHGELLHFVNATKIIFGLPLTLLFIIGLVSVIISFFRFKRAELLFEALIILGSFSAFYAAHSYFWWKGITSLGLIRVMACISPLYALYGLRGLNIILDSVNATSKYNQLFENKVWWRIVPEARKYVVTILVGFAIYLNISTSFKVNTIPVPLPEKEQLVKKTAKWFENSPYKNRKIYVWDAYFYFFLGIDPYDTTRMADGIPDRHHPEIGVKSGEIVIWDAHLSAVDGKFPFDSIASNPYYKLIKVVIPRREILVFGHPYMMCFFERLDSAGAHSNYVILDSLKKAAVPKLNKRILMTEGFESINKMKNKNLLDSGKAISGKRFLHMTSSEEYYSLFESNPKSLAINEGSQIIVEFDSKKGPVILVISLKNRRNIYYYHPTETKLSDDWSQTRVIASLPIPKGTRDKLSIYLWNPNKQEVYIDNITIQLLQECLE